MFQKRPVGLRRVDAPAFRPGKNGGNAIYTTWRVTIWGEDSLIHWEAFITNPMNPVYAPASTPPHCPQRPGWFSRNWKWFTLVCLALLAFMFFILGIQWLLKSNDPYRHAIDLAIHDPQAVAVLGAPIRPGWLVTGSIELSGSTGKANLAVPVHGKTHKGTVYVHATKSDGEWTYRRIVLLVDDGKRIDLFTPLNLRYPADLLNQ